MIDRLIDQLASRLLLKTSNRSDTHISCHDDEDERERERESGEDEEKRIARLSPMGNALDQALNVSSYSLFFHMRSKMATSSFMCAASCIVVLSKIKRLVVRAHTMYM